MRRFFIGVVAGAIVAALGLGVVSQVSAPETAADAPVMAERVAAPQVAQGDEAAAVPAQPMVNVSGAASDTLRDTGGGDAAPEDADPIYGVSGAGQQTLDVPQGSAGVGPATAAAEGDVVASGTVTDGTADVADAPAPVPSPVPSLVPLPLPVPPDVTATAPEPVPAPVPAPVPDPVDVADIDVTAPLPAPAATGIAAEVATGIGAEIGAEATAAAPVEVDTTAPGAEAALVPVAPPVATPVAPLVAPPATPLIEAPALRDVPDRADVLAAPAGETGAALARPGAAAPRPPGADAVPAAVDLPPPPPPPPSPDEPPIAADAAPTPPPAVAAETAPDSAPDAGPAPVPDAPAAVAVLPDAPDAPGIIAVDSAPSVLAPDAPLIEAAPDPALPTTPSLAEAGEGVIVNRPSAAADAAEAEPALLPDVALDDAPLTAPFAAAFDNPDAKPLFSILLLDTGEPTLDRAAIASLPFAVSVAIDPLAPDAAAHAALYHAGGKEVLMLASGIPAGATPADLEQTFEALATALPSAVAVVDTEAGSFQNDRPLSAQIVPILAAQGRGLVTWDRGLNAADQEARRGGLASTTIFRRIDGDGEGVPVIRRSLDRAAFKAGQEGRVTVLGEARPETVAALVEWAVEGRASAVALAPISAQLTGR